MTKTEMALLLAAMAACDGRRVDDATVLFWHEIVGDQDYTLAQEAVIDHYRHSAEHMKPVHVIEGIARVRERRPPEALALDGPTDDELRERGIRQYVEGEGVDWDAFRELREAGVPVFDAIERLRPEGAQ